MTQTHNPKYDNSTADIAALIVTSRALLLRIEEMTTAQFALGGEREERNALRNLLVRMGELPDDGN